MLVLIDTNILISAALFPGSVPAQAFMKAVTPPNNAVVCDYSLDEMRRVYHRKFPHQLSDFERFIALLDFSVDIVPTPPVETNSKSGVDELKIRDLNDLPIYHAALAARVDLLLTGDKDFLESGLSHPRMINAAEFIQIS